MVIASQLQLEFSSAGTVLCQVYCTREEATAMDTPLMDDLLETRMANGTVEFDHQLQQLAEPRADAIDEDHLKVGPVMIFESHCEP